MKREYIISILIIFIVAILSVNCASAWWDSSFECEGFTIEIPDGLEKATGYSPSTPPKSIPFVQDSDKHVWDFKFIELSEAPLDKLPDNLNVVENHTESNLTILKGQVVGEGVYAHYDEGANITYVEFDKEGKHFYLEITHHTLDKIDLSEDMKLINKIRESIKLK